jgi:hypothetical protein
MPSSMLVILDSTSLALAIDVKGNPKTAPASNMLRTSADKNCLGSENDGIAQNFIVTQETLE